jgi:hypothetical protein
METEKEFDEFFKGLSDAEWAAVETIEAEIMKQLGEGLSKEVDVNFVRTVLEVRKAVPEATVAGVFESAILAGLKVVTGVYIPKITGKPTSAKRKARGKLFGAGV